MMRHWASLRLTIPDDQRTLFSDPTQLRQFHRWPDPWLPDPKPTRRQENVLRAHRGGNPDLGLNLFQDNFYEEPQLWARPGKSALIRRKILFDILQATMTLTDLSQAREERIQFANIELLEKGNLVVIDEVFSSEYLAHVGGNKTRGTAFVQRYVKLVRDALNNVRVVKIDFLNHTDDTVTWQRTLRGTHKNAMLGIPPSGKRVEWKDMLHTRFDGDQIAEEWAVSELAGELMLKLPAKNS